jgi:hypothetical protein
MGLQVLLVLTTAGCVTGTAYDPASMPSTATTASLASAVPTTPTAPPAPVAAGSAAETAEASLAFVDDGRPSAADPSDDARLTVTQVRVGAHDDYDRVVFEVAGTGTPGWDVRYVEHAADEASGKPVDLPGHGALQVVLTGMGYPDDTGQTEWHAGPLTTEGYGQLWEVDLLGTFEGRTQAFLGLKDAGASYRVFALADPQRVVVDVRH